MIRDLLLAGVGGIIVGIVSLNYLQSLPLLAGILAGFGFYSGSCSLLMALLMVWSSKVGKLRERENLLNSIEWRGNETVLDVGCGRGLLLNGVARRLTTGKAIGVDIWHKEDQSGSNPDVTAANARIEGVTDRIEIKNGDARQLPFPNKSFDVIVSSLVLHNIYDDDDRAKALHEIVRVLKPGGEVHIADIQHTRAYSQAFSDAGLQNVRRSGFHFWIIPPVRVVSGTKPK